MCSAERVQSGASNAVDRRMHVTHAHACKAFGAQKEELSQELTLAKGEIELAQLSVKDAELKVATRDNQFAVSFCSEPRPAHRPIGSAAHACAQAKALDEHLAEERLRSQRALADKDQQLRAAEVRCRAAASAVPAAAARIAVCARARTSFRSLLARGRAS
jgi:hypothetical protein